MSRELTAGRDHGPLRSGTIPIDPTEGSNVQRDMTQGGSKRTDGGSARLDDALNDQCVVCSSPVTAKRCEECGSPVKAGDFEIMGRIAAGPHSRMYLAKDAVGRRVALKELLFRAVPSTEQIDAFQREGELLRQLDHPCIPRFRAAFSEGDGPHLRLYLAQDFVEGSSLLYKLRSKRFTEPELIDIAMQVLETLVYLHDLSPKVLHRDIKPANLLVSKDEKVWLVDFGTAREVAKGGTFSSTLVGTFGYMPPEQLGGTVSERSDLYAVGATLVHLLTRVPPDEAQQRKGWGLHDRKDISCGFRSFLLRLLAQRPEERTPTAVDAVLELEGVKVGRRRIRPPVQWYWRPLAIGAGVLSLLLLVAVLRPAEPPEPEIVEVVKEVEVIKEVEQEEAVVEPPEDRQESEPAYQVLVPPFSPGIMTHLSSLGGCFRDAEIHINNIKVDRNRRLPRPILRFDAVLNNRSAADLCQWVQLIRVKDQEGVMHLPELEEKVLLPLSSQKQNVRLQVPGGIGTVELRLGLAQAPDAVYQVDLSNQSAKRLR